MKLYDTFGPTDIDQNSLKTAVRNWGLGVLALPDSSGHISEAYIRYPSRTIVLASDEAITDGVSPAKPYIIFKGALWEYRNENDVIIVRLGYTSIFHNPDAYRYFVAVVEALRHHGLLTEVGVQTAVTQWFLTYIAKMSSVVTRSPIVADVHGQQFPLEHLALDPQTGVVYAEQGSRWIDASGDTARGEVLNRLQTLRVGDLR